MKNFKTPAHRVKEILKFLKCSLFTQVLNLLIFEELLSIDLEEANMKQQNSYKPQMIVRRENHLNSFLARFLFLINLLT